MDSKAFTGGAVLAFGPDPADTTPIVSAFSDGFSDGFGSGEQQNDNQEAG